MRGPDDNGDGNGAGAEYKKQRLAGLMDGEHAVPVLKALAAAESLKAPQQVHRKKKFRAFSVKNL